MVSSAALATAAGVKPSQLRRDLAYFGTFGTRGRGYPVEALRKAIHEGLGRAKFSASDHGWRGKPRSGIITI